MRKIMHYCWILTLAGLLALPGSTTAGIPAKPSPPRLVNDFAGLLSPGEAQQLETSLESFARETSNQIALVIVEDLDGLDKASYAFELGEKWGVGQKGFDNGIVFLIKPKIGNQKGDVFIAVGYGLEGAIPDITAKRIVDNEVIPYFRNEQYLEGIQAGLAVLSNLARGEFSAADYNTEPQPSPWSGLIVFVIFIVIIGISVLSQVKSTRKYALSNSIPFWVAWSILNSTRTSHKGSFGSFSSGRGSFGGFSGGRSSGFGGFGGGSFGGGGAGGSW
jgi:uncharacterized protein